MSLQQTLDPVLYRFHLLFLDRVLADIVQKIAYHKAVVQEKEDRMTMLAIERDLIEQNICDNCAKKEKLSSDEFLEDYTLDQIDRQTKIFDEAIAHARNRQQEKKQAIQELMADIKMVETILQSLQQEEKAHRTAQQTLLCTHYNLYPNLKSTIPEYTLQINEHPNFEPL